VEIQSARFCYRRSSVFNAATYLEFLEKQLAKVYFPKKTMLIQDNASYHKDHSVWEWFKENRKWLMVHNLPPYAPQYNAVERLWHYTRIHGTHNRYFATEIELLDTLVRVFRGMQRHPEYIRGYLAPFL
jgi:transposase